jgi:hypothetical protein
MNNELNDDMEELDSTWLQEFENLDKEYKHYYTEELTFVKIHCIYINKENAIEKMKEERVLLSVPGCLQKEELLHIIKNHSFLNEMKYSLLSILKVNINIEPIHLTSFLKSKNNEIGSSFLQSIKHIDNIKFEKSISMFHDMNELIILFHEKTHVGDLNKTKRVFIHPNANKKTKRNQYKDINT